MHSCISTDSSNILPCLKNHSKTKEPRQRVQRLVDDNVQLRETLKEKEEALASQSLNEKTLQNDEQKLSFYTGLPSWITLMTVFELVSPYLPNTGNCKLSPCEQMLVFLIKIRLNLANADTGDCFNIHNSTVSKIFQRALDVMAAQLIKPLYSFALPTGFRSSMPAAFRQFYKKCCILIDCNRSVH